MSTHPIDIVIPWVDGSDPVWQADHAKYRASKSADNHPARYREWGLFRYWFRGIEQNAPTPSNLLSSMQPSPLALQAT